MNRNDSYSVNAITEDGAISHYEYIVPYLNTTKTVLTSEEIPLKEGDALLIVDNGGCIGAIVRNVITKERKSLGVLIYGYPVFRKNGDGLDYRKENCVKFSMADYNRKLRPTRNPHKHTGIKKSLTGYYWIIQRDGKVYCCRERFPSLDLAVTDREKTIDLPLEELKAKCNFKKW